MSDYWQFPQDSPDGNANASTGSDAAITDTAITDETILESAGVASSAPPPPPGPHGPPSWAQAPQYAPPGRLHRSRNHRLVGGVAGGIARHLGVDPLLIRFATVLVLMSGLGIFAYLAAWVLLPLEPAAGVPQTSRRRGQAAAPSTRTGFEQAKSAIAILVIALALGILFGSFNFFALWLIGGGIWLLSQQPKPVLAQAQQAMTAAGFDTPEQRAVPLSDHEQQQWRRQYEWEAERYGWPNIGEPPAEVLVDAPPRPRQVITRLVLSLLLLLVALATAAAAGNWWDVQPTRMLGIALVTVGAGVVLGAVFRNRARGLIPLGLLLALAMIPVGVITNGAGGSNVFSGGVGVRAFAPTTVAMLQPTYDHAFGELTVDFSELDLAGESRTIDITVAAGELQVLLPPDIGGSVSVEASVGEISVALADGQDRGATLEGINLEGVNIDTGELLLDGSNGELVLNIKASVGDIEVRQVGS